MLLNLLTWNDRGIMSSAYTLSYMLTCYITDIALITEHKLMPHSKCFFDSIDSSYSSVVKISHDINPYSRTSCGKAGVAIMYRKRMNFCVSEIENISPDRVLGIELNHNQIVSTSIFCVYLPANGNIQKYTEVFAELQTLVSYYVTQGNIIIAGDLNAQYISQNSNSSNKKSKHITDCINSNSLVPVNISNLCSGPNYSFIPSRSMIDHFPIDATTAASCHSCQVIDETRLTLTSDHFPILLKLNLGSHPTSQVTTLSRDTKCIQWHKATTETLQTYSEVLTSKIEQSNPDKYNVNVNCLADSITECLQDAAHDVLPSKPFRPLAGYGLPPPPRGNFVDHIFLEAQCLTRILQHFSPLTMAVLSCNSLLHTLLYKIFDN